MRRLTRGAPSADMRRVWAAQERLARAGTRAKGARKLRSLDLWEIRAGQFRLFFCPVPGQRVLAVGSVVVKSSRRIKMAKLQQIERAVHRWRDTLGDER